MKILVTGASGFLGNSLCRKLREEDNEVVGINSTTCNLTLEDSLSTTFRGYQFDQIYHLAAWTKAGDFCLYHPGEQWIINQKINTNVLSWWKEDQPQAKMIAIGTSCSYDPDLELKEENYLKGSPIESLFTYAQTKRMLYSGLLALNKQFGLNYLQVVPSTLYGLGYHKDGRQMHFIFDLIRKTLNNKLNGEEIVLWGDGYQKREIVHVDDFVNATVELNKTQTNEVYNIGSGIEYFIQRFRKDYLRFSRNRF